MKKVLLTIGKILFLLVALAFLFMISIVEGLQFSLIMTYVALFWVIFAMFLHLPLQRLPNLLWEVAAYLVYSVLYPVAFVAVEALYHLFRPPYSSQWGWETYQDLVSQLFHGNPSFYLCIMLLGFFVGLVVFFLASPYFEWLCKIHKRVYRQKKRRRYLEKQGFDALYQKAMEQPQNRRDLEGYVARFPQAKEELLMQIEKEPLNDYLIGLLLRRYGATLPKEQFLALREQYCQGGYQRIDSQIKALQEQREQLPHTFDQPNRFWEAAKKSNEE